VGNSNATHYTAALKEQPSQGKTLTQLTGLQVNRFIYFCFTNLFSFSGGGTPSQNVELGSV
jgi:hypothetical protein